jgi:hypothetical protein
MNACRRQGTDARAVDRAGDGRVSMVFVKKQAGWFAKKDKLGGGLYGLKPSLSWFQTQDKPTETGFIS